MSRIVTAICRLLQPEKKLNGKLSFMPDAPCWATSRGQAAAFNNRGHGEKGAWCRWCRFRRWDSQETWEVLREAGLYMQERESLARSCSRLAVSGSGIALIEPVRGLHPEEKRP